MIIHSDTKEVYTLLFIRSRKHFTAVLTLAKGL